ncbi:glycosyltransferase family 4 protein [Burkholderia sp. FERM BP-3421]|jgi:glycosyltransferase involved in cell wall biosynthesis|uniref:glycosyltransferase family 4 protein n=1 Tax=Burkholderia sp. FERM BP-3421 TaxID=1494466 RepID=UPI0023607100|nr:glycosyltransferase family 4 protein [Burkholderia sp. FERM BP-3421]WDD92636.1 glycosyltransferase family 4 protein [Burkholderia sp. FERM BP-3421]
MKLAFLDPMSWDYDTETPLLRPLGGSQSALCYLAAELARQGQDVSIINGASEPGRDANGVRILSYLHALQDTTLMNGFDAVIVLNLAVGNTLRDTLGIKVPLVLWTGHASDQQAVAQLRQSQERAAWRGFAFVSQWQAAAYQRAFSIPPDKGKVIHNGIAPAFASEAVSLPWYAGRRDPVLAYTSTPFRGLSHLLDAFPAIRDAVPNVRLKVFSSMAVYNVAPEQDEYQDIYERCRRMEGVTYVSAISQPALAKELSQCAALAYPSVFAETFCIAAAEALASGASLLTTNWGALPSLFGEYGAFMDLPSDHREWAPLYSALVIDSLERDLAEPEASQIRRQARIEAVRQRFSWPSLAGSWVGWLDAVLA